MYFYNRYGDRKKFISKESEIEIFDEDCILLSGEDDYDIVVVLEKGACQIDNIKEYIFFLIEHICELDNIAQKYISITRPAVHDFPYEIGRIYIDNPKDIRLEYWGCIENTMFDVGFRYETDRFILKSFGMIKNIPEDWDK